MGYANVNRPLGFRPHTAGGKYYGRVQPRPVPAVRTASAGGNASTDLAIGDAYSLDANGNAYRSGPNDIVRGIVYGFRFLGNPNVVSGNSPESIEYVTGLMGGVGTAQVAVILGIEDGTVDFEVQADTFAVANQMGKFNLADAAPDSLWAQSRQTVNIGGGAGQQFTVSDIVQSPGDNAYGANARVVCRLAQALS